MKKRIIVGVLACFILGGVVFAINKPKYLTEEEMIAISDKVEENLNNNTRYRFAKVNKIDGTKIEVEFFETPKDYDDVGHNENLNVDKFNLKLLGEVKDIELIGVAVNFNQDELKVNDYVRVGTYEPRLEDKITGYEIGSVIWVETLPN